MLTWNDIIKRSQGGNPPPNRHINKTDEQWQALLTAEQYRITRKAGTEPPFRAQCTYFSTGLYACIGCQEILFAADSQFDSGSGWPSFTQPAEDNAIAYYADQSHGMLRIEAKCNCCDAHLGHVFPDGPEPSGLRYCMNAVALKKLNGGEPP